MKYNEQTIRSKEVFRGKVINVKVDDVMLVNGQTSKRELVQHGGGVAVLPITQDNKIFLVRQFRKPVENEILELPAGKLEKNEEPVKCALRELEEEIGYQAGRIRKIHSIYPSPGYTNEIIHIFVAHELRKTSINRDPGEFMDIIKIDVQEAVAMIYNGQIVDGKTIIGILSYVHQNNKWL